MTHQPPWTERELAALDQVLDAIDAGAVCWTTGRFALWRKLERFTYRELDDMFAERLAARGPVLTTHLLFGVTPDQISELPTLLGICGASECEGPTSDAFYMPGEGPGQISSVELCSEHAPPFLAEVQALGSYQGSEIVKVDTTEVPDPT